MKYVGMFALGLVAAAVVIKASNQIEVVKKVLA